MNNKQTLNLIEGEILLLNKPLNWTSFDIVNKIRIIIRNKLGIKKIKIGHAGTLDPLATGLLIVCTGKATKKIANLQETDKEYTGSFCIGETTPSFDRETMVDKTYDILSITHDMIYKTATNMVGEQMQEPPIFSAKKVQGQRL